MTAPATPVSRRSHTASSSVEQYSGGAKLSSRLRRGGRPGHLLPPTDPAGTAPGRDHGAPDGAGRHLAAGLDRVQREPEASADLAQRRTEATGPVGPPPGSKSPGSRPKPISSKSSAGESRLRQVGESPRITSRSSRRWIEVRTSGTASEMNPGLLPVLWIEVRPCRQAAVDPLTPTAGSMAAGPVELAPGRHDVGPGPSRRQTSSKSHSCGMYRTQSGRARGSVRGPRWPAPRSAPGRTARRRRGPPCPGCARGGRPARGRDAR